MTSVGAIGGLTVHGPQVDEHSKVARINGHEIRQGDWISLNGSTGEIVRGKQPLAPPELAGDLGRCVRMMACWCACALVYVCWRLCVLDNQRDPPNAGGTYGYLPITEGMNAPRYRSHARLKQHPSPARRSKSRSLTGSAESIRIGGSRGVSGACEHAKAVWGGGAWVRRIISGLKA